MENLEEVKTKPKGTIRKGGTRATLFVYVTVGLENMPLIANAMSIFSYFYGYMNFSLSKSATMLTNWMGTAYLLSLFGGFVCDTYLPRFRASLLFGFVEVSGYALLAVQAFSKKMRPFPCKDDIPALLTNRCEKADSGQVVILYAGLYLVAIGVGGLKAALPSLGADQFDEEDPEEAKSLASFFNYFLFSIVSGSIFGVTFLVWISTEQGWDWSFMVSTLSVLTAVLFLCMGLPFYRHNTPKGSPLSRIMQVFVAAVRNRNLPLPATPEEYHEIHDKEAGLKTEILQKTNQFKFLDRAAIIKTTDSTTSNKPGPWRMCTVTQVEETKILVRMLPIIVSTIFMNTCLAQLQTFSIQQANTLDRNLLGFKVPASSIPVIPLGLMFFFIPIYDRFLVPILRKLTGIPTGIRPLQRIAIGLVLSAISMGVAGFVEKHRKHVAVKHNMVDTALPLPMSVFWLAYQFAIFGIADMFTLVGLLEFFYMETSAGMKSLGTAISWTTVALGYYLSTATVNTVNKVSGGWLRSNNLNRDKLNYFFWLLSGLSVLNLGFYMVCASWYRYKKVGIKQIQGDNSVEMGSA